MNDRVLNEKESLELIAQMIQNTKSRMTRNSGAPFLIWGYTTIIVSLLVWFLLKETGNYHWQWLWFLLPAISLPSTLWIEHKQPKMIKTYIDRIVGYVWAVFGLGGLFVSWVSIFFWNMSVLFCHITDDGNGDGTDGTDYKDEGSDSVCGVVGALASVGVSMYTVSTKYWFLHRLFVFMMVIPGHYLNGMAKAG